MPLIKCEECIFWLRAEDGDTRTGACRINSPVIVDTGSEEGRGVRPVTRDVDGCGQGVTFKVSDNV